MSQRGLFITLEGGEGAGKTTSRTYISEFLKQRGITVLETREPGGTEVSEAIRHVLLDSALPAMHADTELLLMFAARNEHLQKKILPALAVGHWVICDRFTDATYAYQGYGRGLDHARIAVLETWAQGDLRPDYTLLFDIDVQTGMQRVRARSEQLALNTDRFEQEKSEFFDRIRTGYLERAKFYPDQYRIIEAAKPVLEVQQQLKHVLDAILVKASIK
ncbi:dTMP kinase [uncultured Thiothrix sp.]|uniref:dTMP kinase n=1 Tax=uncultured Thiothrix sp. TaxID=223185 RepID=UPI0026288CCD|nr:dTMP kinase [uncultured Thiothrix sp.]